MTRIATFIACDQVAQAGLGKLAFIGTYGGDIMLPRLPFTLEQLFFVVRLRSPIDDPPKKFVVRLERPGVDPFLLDQTAALAATGPPPGVDATFLDVQAIVRIAPFEVHETGTIRLFVVDEVGDNYAGGIRITTGVHPEMRMPQIAQGVALAGGHYKRLKGLSAQIRNETAAQLIEAMSSLADDSGFPTSLQFPDSDVRLTMDGQRVHVFFPKPLKNDDYDIAIEPISEIVSTRIEAQDCIGFIVKFEPSAPVGGFNYELVLESEKGPAKAKPAKSRRTGNNRKTPRK